LLWGVTGSGKTEVFFDIINETIKNSQQVLLILPEIAIGESITDRFFNAFGFYPVIWNSKSKNKTNFNNITNGNVSVVIGSRCSIFLPFKNLGLIVVDEEHDNSYKQTTSPIYNCRDLAVLHGKTQNIKVILASATPSLESFFNTQRKQYELIRLTYRHNERPLPTIKFSISENNEICSAYTLQRVAEELANNKQIVFFLNRRGFAQIVNCKNCFSRLQCKKCQNMLTFHYSKKILLCHKCGANYNSDTCVLCKTFGSLVPYGIGVEKIQKYLLEKFNNYNIKIISSDTCDSIEEIKNFISDMKNKMIDIAIGTQILAKGHNFPEISLVVILGLNGMAFNFKATEQTFQTLVQVSGRAGRGDTNAEVIVQIDRNFDSLIMQYLKNHDYEKFLHYEIEERRKWNLMPFVKIIAVKYFNKSESICIDELKKCKQTLNSKIFLQISEPIFIKFSNNTYYYQLFLRISRENFIEYNDALRGSFDNKFIIDVDPISFDF
jgi:primosomal protein N' (replication factor Y)